MAWDVEFTGQFETWWNSLSEDEQVEISAKVKLLQERGPTLPRPHADVISTSRHANMKEYGAKSKSATCACCMRSTLAARRCFCLAATRRAIPTGTRSLYRLQTICSIST